MRRPTPRGSNWGMRLDHLSYAVSYNELLDTVQRLGRLLGGTFVDGGRHPRFGTTNFVLPLVGGMYFEVVAPLDHPATEKLPFGRAVRARAEAGGGWLAYVVAVDDITAIETRLGRRSAEGQRVRPDGVVLTWRQIGLNDVLVDHSLPYFTQWTTDPADHPSLTGSPVVGVAACEIAGDPVAVRAWLGGELDSPIDDTEVHWVDSAENGLVAVHFRTASGDVVRVD